MLTLKPFKYIVVLAIGAVSLLSTTNAQDGVYSVATIADLVKLNPNTYKNVYVRGRNSVGDGGEGMFYNLSNTAATNMGTVFAGTGTYANRRWFRNYSGAADIKWWGLNGSTADQAKLANAISAVDSLYFSRGTYRVSANIEIPRAKKIIVEQGALFSIDANVTLTIRCAVDAGFYSIFSGAGNVNFSTFPQVDRVPVTWFGADPTYGDDSTVAFQKALNAAVSALPTRVYVPNGQYKITAPLTVPRRVTLEGESLSSALYFTANANNMTMLTLATEGDNTNLKGLSLVNNPKAGVTGSSAISASSVTETFLDDVFIESFDRYGVYVDSSSYIRMNRVRIMRTKNKVANSYYGVGVYIANWVAGFSMRECRVNANDVAFKCDKIYSASFDGSFFELNGQGVPGAKNTLVINDGDGVSIKGCYFEGNYTGAAAGDAVLSLNNCDGVHLSGSFFAGDYASTINSQNFIYVGGSSKGVVVDGNSLMIPAAKFIVVDAPAASVQAHKNSYFATLNKTSLTRYDDIAARMSPVLVDIDVPSAFTWTPGLLPNNEIVAATVNFAGAKKGRRDQVLVHFDNLGANDLVLTGYVQNDGQIRVLLENRSGLDLNIGAGNLSIRLQKMD